METDPALDPTVSEVAPPLQAAPDASPSVLDDLRSLREAKAKEASPRLTLDVPAYEGRLAVVYAYPEDGYKRAVRAVEAEQLGKDPDARLYGASDLLIACCGSVVGRNAAGKPVDLKTDRVLAEDELPGEVLRFNAKLAEAMQIAVPSEVEKPGRFIVRELFSPRGATSGVHDGDMALISHANQVFMWLNGNERKLDEEFLGE